MPIPVLVGVALQTAGRYAVTNGAKKAAKKYGPEVFKQIQKDSGLKTVGNKVIKKRMTDAQRKEQSKDFTKKLTNAQRTKKGLTDKQFSAKVDKDMIKQKRIDKVKAENMAATRKPLYGGGRSDYNKGGVAQPSYKSGDMPKAKPC
tara:strand:+ start:35 stop:472 length:438 start_codon:yes stop_codon:yes gene_type:complete